MTIIQAMQQRRSVRTFSGRPLSSEAIESLLRDIAGADSPFGGSVSIRLKSFDLKGPQKPGTYGIISGAGDFFLIGMRKDEDSALTAGFRFEEVVLKAWQKGFGTCWIAATFKGSDFDRGQEWPDNEELSIICPVGIPARKSFIEKVTRFAAGSNNRKPFDKLFYKGNFSTPLSRDNRYAEALEMLRLAPSSTNSQPWRALVEGDKVHFYYKPAGSLSILDCGIGMRHFYDTEMYNGRSGHFIKDTACPAPPDNWRYLRTYCPE